MAMGWRATPSPPRPAARGAPLPAPADESAGCAPRLSPKGARAVKTNYLSPRPYGGEGTGAKALK